MKREAAADVCAAVGGWGWSGLESECTCVTLVLNESFVGVAPGLSLPRGEAISEESSPPKDNGGRVGGALWVLE